MFRRSFLGPVRATPTLCGRNDPATRSSSAPALGLCTQTGRRLCEPGGLSILAKALRGIRVFGLRRALQVVLFSLEKVWLDRRYAPSRPDWTAPGTPPGRRRGVIPVDGGVVVEFESARLEALFLAPDLL